MARRQKQRKRKSPQELAAQRLAEQSLRNDLISLEMRSASFLARVRLEKALEQEEAVFIGLLNELRARLDAPVEVGGALTMAIIRVDSQVKDLANRLVELKAHEESGFTPPPASIKPLEVPENWENRGTIQFVMALNASDREANLYTHDRPKCLEEVPDLVVSLSDYRESLSSSHDKLVRVATRMQRLGVTSANLASRLELYAQAVAKTTTGIDSWLGQLKDSLQRYFGLAAKRDQLLEEARAKEHAWERD